MVLLQSYSSGIYTLQKHILEWNSPNIYNKNFHSCTMNFKLLQINLLVILIKITFHVQGPLTDGDVGKYSMISNRNF